MLQRINLSKGRNQKSLEKGEIAKTGVRVQSGSEAEVTMFITVGIGI